MKIMLGLIPMSIAMQLLAGAALMFAIGAVHVWVPSIPPIGYVQATAIVICLFALSLLGTFGIRVTFRD
jgi:hypothetical protein